MDNEKAKRLASQALAFVRAVLDSEAAIGHEDIVRLHTAEALLATATQNYNWRGLTKTDYEPGGRYHVQEAQ